MNNRLWTGLCVLTGVLGFVWGNASQHDSQPHCPTEDSCTVDYRDGEWHIREVNP